MQDRLKLHTWHHFPSLTRPSWLRPISGTCCALATFGLTVGVHLLGKKSSSYWLHTSVMVGCRQRLINSLLYQQLTSAKLMPQGPTTQTSGHERMPDRARHAECLPVSRSHSVVLRAAGVQIVHQAGLEIPCRHSPASGAGALQVPSGGGSYSDSSGRSGRGCC